MDPVPAIAVAFAVASSLACIFAMSAFRLARQADERDQLSRNGADRSIPIVNEGRN